MTNKQTELEKQIANIQSNLELDLERVVVQQHTDGNVTFAEMSVIASRRAKNIKSLIEQLTKQAVIEAKSQERDRLVNIAHWTINSDKDLQSFIKEATLRQDNNSKETM